MSGEQLVSIVVPCYNYGRFLSSCLTSIFSQEGSHRYEVIVVDDGSTDETQSVLRSFAHSRLQVITHATNLGHTATVNEGVQVARGELIARLDADDRYHPHFLSTVLEKFSKYPKVGLVYGDVALIDEQGKVTQKRVDRIHGGKEFKGNELIPLLKENLVCCAGSIGRREAWEKALPIPEGARFIDDWYFTLCIAQEYDFYYTNRVLAEYRVHAKNLHTQSISNRNEERAIFWVLDQVFRRQEASPDLQRKKQLSFRDVYAAQYRTLADKYFGFWMNQDALRCYLRALSFRPSLLFGAGLFLRVAATLIGRGFYERIKTALKPYLKFRANR